MTTNDLASAIVPLYARSVDAYDRQRGRGLFEREWLGRFVAAMPADGRGRDVLDLGCGMGEPIARWLIGQGLAVTGVDAAAGMIDLCRERFSEHDRPGHEWPGHEWIVADMRALALARRFDGILAWDSFFHLTAEDQRAMFPVFARHAADGAALMFTSGPAAGEAIGAWQGEPLYHASLDPAEYRTLLDAHGFHVLDHRAEDPACGGHTVWLARYGACA